MPLSKEQGDCICDSCPSQPDCATDKFPLMFCFSGKAGCKVDKHGRTCPSCSVMDQYGLQNDYYCTNGSGSSSPRKPEPGVSLRAAS